MSNPINKVIYDGNTLIDISGTTATPSEVLSGETFFDKDGVQKSGSCTYDADTTDATASSSEILSGETAYVSGTKLTGSMTNNGSWSDTIDDVSDAITIPVGFHDGGGDVQIDSTEAAKIIAGNIKNGVTILGVLGTYSGEAASVQANKNATPDSSSQVILPDQGYDYLAQVTVAAVPYVETPTTGTNGYTATIL